MKVDSLKLVSQKDIEIFRKIEKVMELLPDIKLIGQGGVASEELVSCHMLGRAFEKFFPVKCVDGFYYGRGWRHSWLVVSSGNIIDHYPWGMIGGPLLIVDDRFNPSFRPYDEHELDCLDENETFRLHTQQVTAVMWGTIKDHGLQ